MLKKHVIFFGFIVSIILIFMATTYYPGGSNFDKTTVGFQWEHNYISNLFGETAVNGEPNSARFWAIAGICVYALSISLFFMAFSKKIPIKSASNIIKYFGVVGMVFTFLISTPLHDIMVTISSTIYLVSMFYISVFVFRSKLPLLKVLCILYLVFFYGVMYIYGSGDFREYLPIIQKVLFSLTMFLVLLLHYFTKPEDFQHEIERQSKSKKK